MASIKITFNVVAALLVLTYSLYFTGRYAQFSLTVDHQSLAIQRLTNHAIINSNGKLITPGINITATPNRTPGCSFLILEEIWRDCKTIIVGTAQKKIGLEDTRELRSLISPIINSPCNYSKIINTIESSDIYYILECGKSKKIYRASVYYLLNKELILIGKIDGEIM